MSGCWRFLKISLQGSFMDVLLLLGKVRQNSSFLGAGNFFITKPNPNYEDNAQWQFILIFLADVKEVEARYLRERKISDKPFFISEILWYPRRCCTCGNKVKIIWSHVIEEKILLNHIESHLLAFIFFMNFGNEYVSHRHILYQNVKKRKMGFGEFFWKIINVGFGKIRVDIVLRLGASCSVF